MPSDCGIGLSPLYHTGKIAISFLKDGVKGQTIYQPYDLEPELSKTKRFAHHLKNKLSHKYIIRDQIRADFYCEYTATVDLAIKKTDSFLIDVGHVGSQDDNFEYCKCRKF